MRKVFKHNGLAIVLGLMFLFSMVGQALTGHREYNHEQRDHGQPAVGFGQYLGSGQFWEVTGENWESEFLQMAMFVVLTVFLFQKGSSQSKDPDKPADEEEVNADPRLSRHDPDAPGPVRRGGWRLWVYSNSLSLTFAALFVVSFVIHAVGGAAEYNQGQREHAQEAVSVVGYVATSRFWFESFQNWQSEFLSLGAMVVLTVFLRQRGSAESKPVATPHTGSADDPPAGWQKPQEAKGEAAEDDRDDEQQEHEIGEPALSGV